MNRPFLSVVIPAFCSGATLPELLDRLERTLSALDGGFEVIAVDDGSPDETWAVLKELKAGRDFLRIVRLTKNSGQHNALLCGLGLTRGRIVVTMDDDLQNPPEEVPKLVRAIEAGYDLAIGAYETKQHSQGRNLAGRLVDAALRRIFKMPADFQLTSFRAAGRGVIDSVVKMGAAFPYITAMLFAHTDRYINVPVLHLPRRAGRSNYTLKRGFRLVFNLLLHYSSYPLYLVMGLCLMAFSASTLLAAMVFWQAFTSGTMLGWASLMVSVSFFSGLTLLALVVHSLYLARLTSQTSRSGAAFTIGELHE